MWRILCAVEKWSGYCAWRCQRLRDCQTTLNFSNLCPCAFTHKFHQSQRAIFYLKSFWYGSMICLCLIVIFPQLVYNEFWQSRSKQRFLVPRKWLEIWPTDALNLLDHRSHLGDWGWLGFTFTENTKKLVTKWVIISGPKTASASKSWTY